MLTYKQKIVFNFLFHLFVCTGIPGADRAIGTPGFSQWSDRILTKMGRYACIWALDSIFPGRSKHAYSPVRYISSNNGTYKGLDIVNNQCGPTEPCSVRKMPPFVKKLGTPGVKRRRAFVLCIPLVRVHVFTSL